MTQVVKGKCKACNLPPDQRRDLDKRLARGEAITQLAQRFNLSRDVLYRHRNAHLPALLTSGADRSLRNSAASVLEGMLQKMEELITRTEQILDRSEERNQTKNSLLAIRELRNSIETTGRIITSMHQGSAMDETEREELQHLRQSMGSWQEELPEEDRYLIFRLSVEKILEQDNLREAHNLYESSWILREYGPTPDQMESLFRTKERIIAQNLASTNNVDQDTDFRIDSTDFILQDTIMPDKQEMVRSKPQVKELTRKNLRKQ